MLRLICKAASRFRLPCSFKEERPRQTEKKRNSQRAKQKVEMVFDSLRERIPYVFMRVMLIMCMHERVQLLPIQLELRVSCSRLTPANPGASRQTRPRAM